MNTQKSDTPPTDFWESVRGSVVNGIRDLRDRGDELARQGRLRMDLVQAQRRLKKAYEALGQATFENICKKEPVEPTDPRFTGFCERVRYYADEIERLQKELTRTQHQPD